MKKVILALAMLLLFAACTRENEQNGGDENNGRQSTEYIGLGMERNVVATVNGIDICELTVRFVLPQAEFAVMMDNILSPLEGEEFNRAVLEEAVRQSARFALFEDYARRHGIYLSADDIQEIHNDITELREDIEDESEFFQELLSWYGINIESWEHVMHYIYVYDVLGTVMDAIIASEELFAEFAAYLEDEEEEEILAAKHILFALTDPMTEEVVFESMEEMTEFANEIYERILAGEDFDTLMQTYSQDPGLMMSPNGYTFPAGTMVAEFEETTRNLEIGEMSEPFTAFHGIHIVLRIAPDMNNIMRSPMAPPPQTIEQRMATAVFTSNQNTVDEAEFVFLPELYEIEFDFDMGANLDLGF
jgi:hypothetical protein